MKIKCAALAVAFLICTPGLAGDYVITIDGKEAEVDLGKEATVELGDGRSVRVMLERKPVVTFRSENFSFEHPSAYTPSRTDLGDGVFQTLMASPLGTLVLVQEYTSMNPSGLIDMLVTELTKEEVEYGYEITRSAAKKSLSTGEELKGTKAVAKYRGEESTRHVLCYEARDAGIIVVTQIDGAAPAEDKAILDTFWNTFKIAMK